MSDELKRAEQAVVAWGRIEVWLEEHAPCSRRRLPGPAAEEEIRDVEHRLDLVIPAELRAFYLLRNGTGPASCFDWPVWGEPRPTPEEQWGGYLLPDGGIGPVAKPALWSGGPASLRRRKDPRLRYLPFAATDPDGLYGLLIDCTPGEGYGRVGRYASALDPAPGLWPSLAAYLGEVADALEERRSIEGSGSVPGLVGQSLSWGSPKTPAEGWRPLPG
ncbi:SMI1/KNR4 family protein [Nocardiopsis sp. CNT-189]|uniref:SMI1/KNR4 family protein n=1 Tax=Nocardiopsis oceanisediminis TaxID=2816862 RepID=UPI003B313A51